MGPFLSEISKSLCESHTLVSHQIVLVLKSSKNWLCPYSSSSQNLWSNLSLFFTAFLVVLAILHKQRLNTRSSLTVNIVLLVTPPPPTPLFRIGRQYFKHFPSSRPLVVFFLLRSEATGIEQTNQFIVVHAALNIVCIKHKYLHKIRLVDSMYVPLGNAAFLFPQ